MNTHDRILLENLYTNMNVLEEKLVLKKRLTEDDKYVLVIVSDTASKKETFSKKNDIKNTRLFRWDGNIQQWVSWKSYTADELKTEAPKYLKALSALNDEAVGDDLSYEQLASELEDFLEEGFSDKIEQFLEDLKRKIKENADSPELKEFQEFGRKFRKYSFNNRMLIWLQRRNATNVASKTDWKNKFGRYPKKGETAIKIYGFREGKDREMVDPNTGQVSIEVGKKYFPIVNVYDISQTEAFEGKGHLTPSEPKWYDETTPDEKTKVIYDALIDFAQKNNISVTVGEEGLNGARGVSKMGSIQLLQENISTLIHEIAHEILHKKEDRESKDRKLKELEAEGVAYVVLREYELPAEHASVYLTLWKIDPENVREHEDNIRRAAKMIIDHIDSFGTETENPEETPNVVQQESFKKFFTEACWKNYKQVGMKKKGKKMVPNCVPKKKKK